MPSTPHPGVCFHYSSKLTSKSLPQLGPYMCKRNRTKRLLWEAGVSAPSPFHQYKYLGTNTSYHRDDAGKAKRRNPSAVSRKFVQWAPVVRKCAYVLCVTTTNRWRAEAVFSNRYGVGIGKMPWPASQLFVSCCCIAPKRAILSPYLASAPSLSVCCLDGRVCATRVCHHTCLKFSLL